MTATTHPAAQRHVCIPVNDLLLRGTLTIPEDAFGIVLFAHGSGSGRHSPRNQAVSRVLQNANVATLLFDLLEESEAADRSVVFDVPLLADRLQAVAGWAHREIDTRGLPMGIFGASTGAAAALMAAARRQTTVAAVVSRGGRPDLAMECLSSVEAPTLLIVGGDDHEVVELNRQALTKLHGVSHMEIVPGATHLFAEPGALMKVAELASKWFAKYLRPNWQCA